jgi:hypothetical protein
VTGAPPVATAVQRIVNDGTMRFTRSKRQPRATAVKAENASAAEDEAPGDGRPMVSPDVVEEEFGGQMDNLVPSYGYHMTPMVRLGGSAGPSACWTHSSAPCRTIWAWCSVVVLHCRRTITAC